MTDKGRDLKSGMAASAETVVPEQAFADAARHFRDGRLDQAESAVSDLRRLLPDHPDVLHLSALVALKSDRAAEAIGYLDSAVSIDPGQSEYLNLLGAALKREGRIHDAVSAYRKAVALEPRLAAAHYNLGNALKALKRWNDAVPCYREAVALQPDFAAAHFNLALSLEAVGQIPDAVMANRRGLEIVPDDCEALNFLGAQLIVLGRYDEAADVTGRALEINGDDAKAHFNRGMLMAATGKLPEAETALRQSLRLAPDHAGAHEQLGNIMVTLGRIDDAIEHLLAALERDPDNVKTYSALGAAIKVKVDEGGKRETIDPYVKKCSSAAPLSPEPAFLAYWLDGFSPETARRGHRNAVRELPPIEKEKIKFTAAVRTGAGDHTQQPPKREIALLQWARSGTAFLHCLLDGHSRITTIPGYYLTGFFGRDVWALLSASDREEMVDKFMSLYDVLFDAGSLSGVPGYRLKDGSGIGAVEGYTTMGENRDQILSVDRKSFARHLTSLLERHATIDRGTFFRLVHVAFEHALGRRGDADVIFFHFHHPDNYEILNYLRSFPRSMLTMMLREPLQSCESWLTSGDYHSRKYEDFCGMIIDSLFKFDQVVFTEYDARGIRLEDLKFDTDETLKSLCGWLGIEEEESLWTPTMQGLKWWGDTSSVRFGRTKPVVGFDEDYFDPSTDPVKREVGHLFSERDQLVLGTLFYPLRVLYGYTERDDRRFAADLGTIRPMLDEPLDFERTIMKSRLPPGSDLKSNGHFRLLRAALKDRWRTLDANGTYGNMIPPLRN